MLTEDREYRSVTIGLRCGTNPTYGVSNALCIFLLTAFAFTP